MKDAAAILPDVEVVEGLAAKRRLKPYPAYRDTGTEWLPQVPVSWDMKRLKFAVRFPKKSEARGLRSTTPVSFVPMEAVSEYGGVDASTTRELDSVINGYTYFREGDVLIAKITPCFENGKGSIATDLTSGIGFGTTELYVVRALETLDVNYLFYATITHQFRSLGAAEMYGAGGQKRVPDDFVREHVQPLPPLPEQRAIAAFLDRETKKIDELIAKKERLIELLQEKRTALISEAVTKGIDGNIAFQTLSSRYIQRSPQNWRFSKLRWYTHSIRDGTHNPPPRADGFHRLLSVRNIINGQFVLRDDDRTMTPEAFAELQRSYTVEPGDVLLAIVGATTGKSAVAPKYDNVTVQRSLAIVRPRYSEVLSRFLNYWIISHPLQAQIGETADKYAAQPGIYLDDVAELNLPIPPLEEQQAIVLHLDSETDRIDELLDRIRKGVIALREYRSALISAAVTGQIDVRGEVGA